MKNGLYANFLKAVGNNVRQCRIDKGLTMEKLANDANMEVRQLGRIERGEINTTITSLKKLAVVLQQEVHLFLMVDVE